MAIFKVGDRVRIRRDPSLVGEPGCEGLRGVPTVITARWDGIFYDWELDLRSPSGKRIGAMEYALEHVDDDDTKADEFIERIKKLKPYEEPVVAPKRAPVIAPTAIYRDMTIVCTPDGAFAYRDGEWTKL